MRLHSPFFKDVNSLLSRADYSRTFTKRSLPKMRFVKLMNFRVGKKLTFNKMKKTISSLFDSKKINSSQNINGGLYGSMGSTSQTDTGLTANGTYDIETEPKGGGCDAQNTGYASTNDKDNPSTAPSTNQ